MRRLLSAVLGVSLCACGSESTKPSTTESAAQPATSHAPTVALCTNDERGWAISYPEGWHTNPTIAAYSECSFFDPEEITRADLAQLTDSLRQNPPDFRPAIWATRFLPGQRYALGGEQQNFEEITVAGHDAARWEERGVPGAIMRQGERAYVYRLFLDDGAYFMAGTRSFAADDADEYERLRDVLDEMVSTVQLETQ